MSSAIKIDERELVYFYGERTGTRTKFDDALAQRLASRQAKTELMQVICQGRPREQDVVAARLDAAHGGPMSIPWAINFAQICLLKEFN